MKMNGLYILNLKAVAVLLLVAQTFASPAGPRDLLGLGKADSSTPKPEDEG